MAMRFVMFPEMRAHLRLSDASDDAILELYGEAATDYINKMTGQSWDWPEWAEIPPAVKVAALLLLADMYENREAQTTVALHENKTVERLLAPYRRW